MSSRTRHKMRAWRRALAAAATGAAVSLVLGACGSSGTSSTSEPVATTKAEAGIVVTGQWARATAPGAGVGAIYAEIESKGEADALVGVTVPTDIAAEAQIHVSTTMPPGGETTTTMNHAGMNMEPGNQGGDTSTSAPSTGMAHGDQGSQSTGMQQVAKLEIPAGGTLTLAPGGSHIMLMGLVKPLVAGEAFQATLQFDKSPAQTISVEVRDS